MTYSIHSPICDTNIASLNERMREASVDEMISVMECAVKMDISTVTIHPGIYSLAIPNMRNASVEQARISLKQLEREANDLGIVPAIENMPNFPIMMGQTAEELGELIDGTDLKICFDIGHANTTCQTDEFIEMFKDSIVNIHIHDNNGDRDAHMTVGDGNIDFDSVLSKLKSYSGKYIIESKTFESAIASKRYLEESFDF